MTVLVCKSCNAAFEEQHDITCVYCNIGLSAEYVPCKRCVLCTNQCQEALSTGIEDICKDGCVLNIYENGNNN